MKTKLQFGIWLLTVGVGVAIAFPAEGQNRPPKPQPERRQEQRQERRQERQPERRNERNQGNPNRPPATNQSVVPNTNRPPERARNQQNTNLPESARNQHLNDPNFTRGMSDEDKSMLRDLSHLHVGGAPEPPNE